MKTDEDSCVFLLVLAGTAIVVCALWQIHWALAVFFAWPALMLVTGVVMLFNLLWHLSKSDRRLLRKTVRWLNKRDSHVRHYKNVWRYRSRSLSNNSPWDEIYEYSTAMGSFRIIVSCMPHMDDYGIDYSRFNLKVLGGNSCACAGSGRVAKKLYNRVSAGFNRPTEKEEAERRAMVKETEAQEAKEAASRGNAQGKLKRFLE